jgi:8-oxo-dGTP pyrophosphatase MutT (NUDIX family)
MGNKPYASYLSSSQVFLIKKTKGETLVLLQQRRGGWADKKWEAGASGHIDEGESPIDAIIHEAKEELCIKVNKKDVEFITVIYKKSCGETFYNFSFICKKWTGTPVVGEPDKIIQIKWFNINKLPTNMIPDRKLALNNYLKKVNYSEYIDKK